MDKLLIVGGSSGVGLSVLRSALESGRELINISRNHPSVTHPAFHHLRCDVLNDPLPAIDDISQIVYCPGSITLKPMTSLKEQDFIDDFNINVLAAFKVIKQYYPIIKKRENAAIILFSTVAATTGMSYHASIAAAKAGVEGMSRSLAAEFAPAVRVNCISLTLTDTPLAAGILRNDEARQRMAERHPMKSILNADEVAHTVSFLLDPRAKNITGQTIQMDAGIISIKP